MEEVFILNSTQSAANHYLAQLRDINVQKDKLKFRYNLKRLGFLLGYELSKTLNYEYKKVQTPLANMEIAYANEDIVIISILRAAIPFCDGFSEVFEDAPVGFIGAARQEYEKGMAPTIDLSYTALPDITQKTVIFVDPMLATGQSIVAAVQQLKNLENAFSVHICSVVAAPEGVSFLKKNLPSGTQLWTCALDECLNENYYIVPGLGDAGDLAYGSKI